MKSATRAVLTIATGKWVYLNMAIALARSFLWWHRDSSIEFYIATDIADPIGVWPMPFSPMNCGVPSRSRW